MAHHHHHHHNDGPPGWILDQRAQRRQEEGGSSIVHGPRVGALHALIAALIVLLFWLTLLGAVVSLIVWSLINIVQILLSGGPW